VNRKGDDQGQLVTSSTFMPTTCIGEDGVMFTLKTPNSVKIAKLPDINGYELVSPSGEPFQLLVGTEGQANRMKIINRSGLGKVDVEGVEVAEIERGSLDMLIEQLLTVGVTSPEMTVILQCTQQESEGLGFQVLGTDGGVVVSRTSLYGGITRSPSKGGIVRFTPTPTRRPLPPTSVPPEEVEPEPEPKPEPEPEPEPEATSTPVTKPARQPVESTPGPGPTKPPAGPTKIPVTHKQSRNPVILDAYVDGSIGGGCGSDYAVTLRVNFSNYLPNIMPGRFSAYITDDNWHPKYSPIYRELTSVDNYQYDDAQQEKGTITYDFCYNTVPGLGDWLYVYFYIFDVEGNQSNRKECAVELPGTNLACQ